jgi:hypothetical protein
MMGKHLLLHLKAGNTPICVKIYKHFLGFIFKESPNWLKSNHRTSFSVWEKAGLAIINTETYTMKVPTVFISYKELILSPTKTVRGAAGP